MAFLSYSPVDPRWQGRPRHYLTAFTIKNLFIIPFVILVVVEGVLYKRWHRLSHEVDIQYGPYDFWFRIGIYLLPDVVLTLAMAYFIHVNRWHPIVALVTSILWSGLWMSGCTLNWIIVYSNEVNFHNRSQWEELGYAEAACQGLISILYLVMMVFSAKAVHEWRKGNKGRAREGVELSGKDVDGASTLA